MIILITGIRGFVGRNLARALADSGNTVIGLSRTAGHIDGVDSIVTWDTLHRLPRVDAVIHAAALAHETSRQSAAEVYDEVNVGLTRRIFELFVRSDASIFIFISSVAAVAAAIHTGILGEDAEPVPATAYGRSKLEAERYILANIPAGRSVYILRPCMIYGPGCPGNLPLLNAVVRRGLPWPLGAFRNERSFLYIGNLEYVVSRILTSDVLPGIYNVADDRPISTLDLVAILAEASGRRRRVWNLSPRLVRALASVGDVLHLPLDSGRLEKLTGNYVVSNRRLLAALDIQAMPFDTREAMARTARDI